MPSPVDTSDTTTGRNAAVEASAFGANMAAVLGRALVLYVVFDGFSHDMFDVSVSSLVSLTLIATVTALGLALITGRGSRLVRRGATRTAGLLLAVFVGYTALSAAVGHGTLDLGFVKNLLLFVAIVALADDSRFVEALLLTAGAAGVLQAALGLRQLVVSNGVPLGGVTGLLPNHVQYAMYLTLSAISMAPFVIRPNGWRRMLLLAAEALMLAMIVASLARGVLVVALCCAVLWLLLALNSGRVRTLMIAGVFAAATAVLVLSRRLGTLLEVPAALGDPAKLDVLLSGRLPLLLAAWNIWLAHPIFGIGYGRFPEVWAQYAPAGIGVPGILRLQLATHSTYLQIAAEMGLVGLALYIALLAYGFRNAWRSRVLGMRSGDVRAALVATAVFVGLFAIAMHGVLDNTGWHDRVFYILLAAAAVTWNAAQCPHTDQASGAGR